MEIACWILNANPRGAAPHRLQPCGQIRSNRPAGRSPALPPCSPAPLPIPSHLAASRSCRHPPAPRGSAKRGNFSPKPRRGAAADPSSLWHTKHTAGLESVPDCSASFLKSPCLFRTAQVTRWFVWKKSSYANFQSIHFPYCTHEECFWVFGFTFSLWETDKHFRHWQRAGRGSSATPAPLSHSGNNVPSL